MNNSYRVGFYNRLADLAERDGVVKSAGFLRSLGRGVGNLLGRGAEAMSGIAGTMSGAASGMAGRVGPAVAGMQPGMARRVLSGPQFAAASPVNPAELGRTVMRRAGGAALGAGALGASNLYGQYRAAEEAKRRAAQSSFMQRLAFLMNPNLVYSM